MAIAALCPLMEELTKAASSFLPDWASTRATMDAFFALGAVGGATCSRKARARRLACAVVWSRAYLAPRFFAAVMVACASMYRPRAISVRLICDACLMNRRSWLDTGGGARLAVRLVSAPLGLAPAAAVPAVAPTPQPAVTRPT